MADDSFQEKSEQATPRRKEKAREKGQVARSTELNSAMMILLGGASLLALGPHIVNTSEEMMRYLLANAASLGTANASMNLLYNENVIKFFIILGPVFAALMVIGFATNVAQVGFHVSTKALEPKFEKLNVIAGIGKMFSMRSLVVGVRDTIKLAIIGIVAYKVIKAESSNFFALTDMSIPQLAAAIGKIAILIAIKIGIAILVLALLDYLYQKWEFERSIRMSVQEIKEEYKDTEGSPQVKSRIRQIQRETARKRMMDDVPKADVVITNPTHYAVALKYDVDHMNAPYVVAKGQNLIAQKIKEIAMECEIPVIEDRQLAQALYKLCDVGEMVPQSLYRAVAEVLAYVYRLKGKVMS
jgi:flagellar biosynthesis protein FlhB